MNRPASHSPTAGIPPISPSVPAVARRPYDSSPNAAGALSIVPDTDAASLPASVDSAAGTPRPAALSPIGPAVVPRRNTQVLNDLIAIAERVLNGPAPAPWIAEVERLGDEVTRAAKRPTDARRTIGEGEAMLIVALRHLCDLALARTPVRDRWRVVTLALLDMARDDLFAALEQENGALAC